MVVEDASPRGGASNVLPEGTRFLVTPTSLPPLH